MSTILTHNEKLHQRRQILQGAIGALDYARSTLVAQLHAIDEALKAQIGRARGKAPSNVINLAARRRGRRR